MGVVVVKYKKTFLCLCRVLTNKKSCLNLLGRNSLVHFSKSFAEWSGALVFKDHSGVLALIIAMENATIYGHYTHCWVLCTRGKFWNARGRFNCGQKHEVPAMAPSNEANTDKGATSTTMGGETLEMEEEKNSSQTNCCFSTRLLEKPTPKGDRRKMACMIVLVAVLAVVNLIVCSLPTTCIYCT